MRTLSGVAGGTSHAEVFHLPRLCLLPTIAACGGVTERVLTLWTGKAVEACALRGGRCGQLVVVSACPTVKRRERGEAGPGPAWRTRERERRRRTHTLSSEP